MSEQPEQQKQREQQEHQTHEGRRPERVELQRVARWMRSELESRVQSSPVATLAGVATVGYVLARGLPDFAVRAARVVMIRAVVGQVSAAILTVASQQRETS